MSKQANSEANKQTIAQAKSGKLTITYIIKGRPTSEEANNETVRQTNTNKQITSQQTDT